MVKNAKKPWIAASTNANVTVIQDNVTHVKRSTWRVATVKKMKISLIALTLHTVVVKFVEKNSTVNFMFVKKNVIQGPVKIAKRHHLYKKHVHAENTLFKC